MASRLPVCLNSLCLSLCKTMMATPCPLQVYLFLVRVLLRPSCCPRCILARETHLTLARCAGNRLPHKVPTDLLSKEKSDHTRTSPSLVHLPSCRAIRLVSSISNLPIPVICKLIKQKKNEQVFLFPLSSSYFDTTPSFRCCLACALLCMRNDERHAEMMSCAPPDRKMAAGLQL